MGTEGREWAIGWCQPPTQGLQLLGAGGSPGLPSSLQELKESGRWSLDLYPSSLPPVLVLYHIYIAAGQRQLPRGKFSRGGAVWRGIHIHTFPLMHLQSWAAGLRWAVWLMGREKHQKIMHVIVKNASENSSPWWEGCPERIPGCSPACWRSVIPPRLHPLASGNLKLLFNMFTCRYLPLPLVLRWA